MTAMNKTQCQEPDCEKMAKANWMCLKHYGDRKREAKRVERGQSGFALPEWAIDSDLAYAAGFIDADGHISINRSSCRVLPTGQTFSLKIAAVGVDIEPLHFLRSLLGGSINSRGPRSGNLIGTLPIHQWYVNGARAAWVAQRILTYLKIKKQQAQALIDYQSGTWHGSPRNPRMPDDERKRRMELANFVRARNARAYLRA